MPKPRLAARRSADAPREHDFPFDSAMRPMDGRKLSANAERRVRRRTARWIPSAESRRSVEQVREVGTGNGLIPGRQRADSIHGQHASDFWCRQHRISGNHGRIVVSSPAAVTLVETRGPGRRRGSGVMARHAAGALAARLAVANSHRLTASQHGQRAWKVSAKDEQQHQQAQRAHRAGVEHRRKMGSTSLRAGGDVKQSIATGLCPRSGARLQLRVSRRTHHAATRGSSSSCAIAAATPGSKAARA